MQASLKPHFGTHVVGPNYWHATDPAARDVAELLMGGESLKVFGLRRIGKSSLMAQAAQEIKARKRPVIWLDLQRINSIAGLLHAILRGLPEDGNVLRRLTAWYDSSTLLPPAAKAKLQAMVKKEVLGADETDLDAYLDLLFEETGKAIAALSPEARPILLLDELPFFCLNVIDSVPRDKQPATVSRLNALLAILRGWRAQDTGVAMALGGSVSMFWLQREHRIMTDHVNDAAKVAVRPMQPANAEAMVRAMIAHVAPASWSADIAETLCRMVPALYPGVLQYAFQQIKTQPALTADTLATIYRDRISEGLEENYYRQFDRRLARYAQPERRVAARLFDRLLAAETIPWADALSLCAAPSDAWIEQELISRLEEDSFILASRTGGVRFADGLVRAWHGGPRA